MNYLISTFLVAVLTLTCPVSANASFRSARVPIFRSARVIIFRMRVKTSSIMENTASVILG